MGTVASFRWQMLHQEQLQPGDLPYSIKVKFDDKRIAGNESGVFEVTLAEVVYSGKKGFEISRLMIPLVLCYAVTGHKIQGITLGKAVMHLGKYLFAKGQAYVILSGVKALNAVGITDLDINKLRTRTKSNNTGDIKIQGPANQRAIQEMNRLRIL